MFHARYDFFRRQVLQSLENGDRELLNAYEELENQLISVAETESELLDMMRRKRLFHKVARQFGLKEEKVYIKIQALEKQIHEKTIRLAESISLQDMTDLVALYSEIPQQEATKFFLLAGKENVPTIN